MDVQLLPGWAQLVHLPVQALPPKPLQDLFTDGVMHCGYQRDD